MLRHCADLCRLETDFIRKKIIFLLVCVGQFLVCVSLYGGEESPDTCLLLFWSKGQQVVGNPHREQSPRCEQRRWSRNTKVSIAFLLWISSMETWVLNHLFTNGRTNIYFVNVLVKRLNPYLCARSCSSNRENRLSFLATKSLDK